APATGIEVDGRTARGNRVAIVVALGPAAERPRLRVAAIEHAVRAHELDAAVDVARERGGRTAKSAIAHARGTDRAVARHAHHADARSGRRERDRLDDRGRGLAVVALGERQALAVADAHGQPRR